MSLSLAGCGSTEAPLEPTDSADVSGCPLVAIHSDYQTTSVSLLSEDGTLCADSILHSGSVAPRLLTALSGDVVVPSAPALSGELVLIDR